MGYPLWSFEWGALQVVETAIVKLSSLWGSLLFVD